MTFSIAAFDPDNGDLGIAVQSKFPNVRVSIPFAQTGVGAVATQSYCNTSFGPRGLTLLANGATPEQALKVLIDGDANRDYRQVGIVDAEGRSAAFTGARCFDWAGSVSDDNFTAQGNTLEAAAVVEGMAETFRNTPGPLVERLLGALKAGQLAGGDRRGQQSAALLVVREGGGYGGHDDRYADISVYDNPSPILELERLYAIHRLTYFRSREEDLIKINADLARELQRLLQRRGFYAGPVNGVFNAETSTALRDFMGWENYDERIRDDNLMDLEVLEDMRRKHATWINENETTELQGTDTGVQG